MSLAHMIYRMAPIPAKALLLNLKAASNWRKRYRRPYPELLEQHKRLWCADLSEVEEYQRERLAELLLEAYDYSPWYQQRFRDLAVQREDILANPYVVLNQLPWLTKRERKQELESLTSTNPARRVDGVGYTSGSTGEPTKYLADKESRAATFAMLHRYYWSIGVPPNKRSVRLSGRQVVEPDRDRPPFWMYNWFEKQLLVSTYHQGDDFLPAIVAKLNRYRPQFIDGYPSATHAIARYILQHEVPLTFKPLAISTTAETLYPHQREDIERAFGCKVFNQYASSEGSPFISECTHGSLHLHIDTGVFEFFRPDGKPAGPGETAEIVVTSFRSQLIPLIRYQIGDMVQLADDVETCTCGCNMPVVERIIGREDDLTIAANGALIGMASYRLFKEESAIIKAQVIQLSREEIVLRVIPDEGRTEQHDEALITKARRIYGHSMKITLERTEDIPLGANGKYLSVIRQFPL